MFKQPIFSLALALLTGAAFTAVGQTTNTMPTQSSGSTTTAPTSQSGSSMSSPSSQSGSSMSSPSSRSSSAGMTPSSGMAPSSGSMSSTGSTSSASGSTSSPAGSMSSNSGSMSSSSGSASSSSSGSMSSTGASTGTSTGKDLAVSAGLSQEHSTLLKALQAAGLADQAKAAGPFTVFAPTNDAFTKLPAGTLDNLLKPSAKKQLAGILTTHVVQGSFKAADLKDGQTIKTVNGETLTVSKQGSTVMIKDAKGGSATVTMPDIQATNGVVHSIDTVLMPSK